MDEKWKGLESAIVTNLYFNLCALKTDGGTAEEI